MSATGRAWPVRLAMLAERDLRDIVLWTENQFGDAQALIYAATLADALERLQKGPDVPGVRRLDDIEDGLSGLKVRFKRREGRHLVCFRVINAEIVVVRILHDAMDLPHHLGRHE